MKAEWDGLRAILLAAGIDPRTRLAAMKHVDRLVTLSEEARYHKTWLDPLWDWLDNVEHTLRWLLGRE